MRVAGIANGSIGGKDHESRYQGAARSHRDQNHPNPKGVQVQVYCGIDWAERHHDVARVDENGKHVARKRINETVDGLAQLVDMLAAAGDSAERPIPVAIETPRGLLVEALRASGRPVTQSTPSRLPATVIGTPCLAPSPTC